MGIFSKKDSAEISKTLTAMCLRNTELEHIHAGEALHTITGDYSDVKVIDALGNEFSWADASHISDAEMKTLVKGVVDRLYTFFMQCDDPRFDKNMDYHKRFTREWDEPDLHPALDCTIEHRSYSPEASKHSG